MSSDKLSTPVSTVRHSSRIAAMSVKRNAETLSSPNSPKQRKLESVSSILSTRKKLLEKKVHKLHRVKQQHEDNVAEEFFLGHGRGNLLDFVTWRKNPPQDFLAHLKANAFEISPDILLSESKSPEIVIHPSLPKVVANVSSVGNLTPAKNEPVIEPLTISIRGKPRIIPNSDASSSSTHGISGETRENLQPTVIVTNISAASSELDKPSTSSTPTSSSVTTPNPLLLTPKTPTVTPRSPGRPPLSIPPLKPAVSAEGSIERAAKQEANVLRRIAELRRQGLWSARKMPKCVDPPRNKTHWDYLLEEMQWMAIDFEQERKWKKASARKLAQAIARQKRELEDRGRKQGVEKEKDLKRIAAYMAREVRQFWNNVEKVVEYKSDSILEAKKKRALDLHLDFVVGQTEKFSNLIQESLNKVSSSRSISPVQRGDDSEFEASSSSDDDETTIAKAERHIKKDEVDDEVAMLQKESEMNIDDILDALPAGYIDQYGTSSVASCTRSSSVKDKSDFDSDDDDSDAEEGTNEKDEKVDTTNSTDSASQPSTSLGDIDFKKLQSNDSEERQNELTNIAEVAERLQPKGFTLDAVNIVTKQPFLLKHDLREYQRVGLDWLVTLCDKKLNGILADEMGLGKTIQTIALLAYLACEKHNWGPHLVVVPTTVILNWEMEFKKWCPAFKILTYYGALKERKEKRKGWSKPNSFHVCITSYKLVMQDNGVFRRKNWEYLVLDEAQNIKNFKSQRWQMLLHFKTERRLLLTGTPLQNSLMELWSLMHFLMPQVFGSHKDFRDWFSNPLTGMIEGTQEYNEQTIKRLHKVLRPFLLRRLKSDVEKQLPKKYEHVIMCQLSKRQRFLYDDFMSKGSTKNQLTSGNVMSVMNILMQLRKVCNHPFLFEPRPILSPFIVNALSYSTVPAAVCDLLRPSKIETIGVPNFLLLENYDRNCVVRTRELLPKKNLIEEMNDSCSFDEPSVPLVTGFSLASTLKPRNNSPFVRTPSSSESSKQLQFLIPTSVAQNMNFNDPFIIQLKIGPTLRNVPVMLKDVAAGALQRIGLNNPIVQSSGTANSPPTVLRLVQQNSSKSGSYQAVPVSNGSSIVLNAAVSSATGQQPTSSSASAGRSGIMVSALPSPKLVIAAQQRTSILITGSNIGGIIRAHTQVHPHSTTLVPIVSSTALNLSTLPSTIAVSPIRPKITVQEVAPRSSPVVCVFDPNKVPGSPLVVPKSPSTSSSFGSAASNKTFASGQLTVSDETEQTKVAASFAESATTSTVLPNSAGETSKNAKPTKRPSPETAVFDLPSLKRRKIEQRLSVFSRVLANNRRRCLDLPMYGENLRKLLSVYDDLNVGGLTKTLDERLLTLKPLLDRFVIFVPPVKTTCATRFNAGRSSFVTHEENRLSYEASRLIADELSVVYATLVSQSIQFPELRLIEYDCGKLQNLAALLRKLKPDGSRCLIFTQMTRMLDILEAFLSYHGYTYLRLDGATRIEQRQILMERFNQDAKIFCFILSTRSGGIGVNLTGANTVIFYDSDWNPTMDAQAQDRCHRIGQTRDVHIYRLISEKTVEENILKKASQKRKLGELAIEEGGFTSEFFKKSNIRDIFGLVDADVTKVAESNLSQQELEQAMAKFEDERDVVAAKVARAEAVAELAEFDESQANADAEEVDPDVMKVEQEMKQLMEELKPIERYAVKYLETLAEPDRLNELKQTEILEHKRRWEEAQQIALEDEKRQRKEMEDDEFALTYQTDEALAQIWMPPTPPLSDNEFDAYVDPFALLLYESEPMNESDLPPVFAEKEILKTPIKSDPVISSVAVASAPPPAAPVEVPPAVAETIANIRNSAVQKSTPKDMQPRNLFSTALTSTKMKQTPRRNTTPPPAGVENEAAEVLQDWNVIEDYALLNAVTKGQQMTYSLVTGHDGHAINWDYVAEWVTLSCSRYRSPKQCHKRYESVILPREEGRPIFLDALSKKSRKGVLSHQELSNAKKLRMRTGNQFQLEGQNFMVNHVNQKFHCARTISAKKAQITKATGFSLYGVPPSSRMADKHASVLTSYGINYDVLMSPLKLVENYEEKQRQKEIEAKKQQQLQQQQQQQQQQNLDQQQQQHQQSLVRTPGPSAVQTSFVPGSPQLNPAQNQISFIVSSPGRVLAGKPLPIQPQQPSLVNSVVTVSGSPQRVGPSNLTALISRPPILPQGNTTTATVFRQVAPQSIKIQRTPPGTPAPVSNVHGAAYVASGTLPRTVVTVPGNTEVSALVVQTTPPLVQPPSDFTSLIKQPQSSTANIRFQPPTQPRGSRVQVTPQYGGSGTGFLVSAEVPKPNVTNHPIATIIQGNQARYMSGQPLRAQLHLATPATGGPHFKKGTTAHLTRLAVQAPGVRGVQLIPQTARLASPARTPPHAAHLIRASNATLIGQKTSIPSVSCILSSSAVTVSSPTIIVQSSQGLPVLPPQQQQPSQSQLQQQPPSNSQQQS